MLKGQLYKYLHQYLGDYLFGFDKSQLDVAILSGTSHLTLGQIDLKDVNVRPNKINELLNAAAAPFSLKAGMIGKLCLQYNLLSFLSNPFTVSVADLQVILGPNTSLVSERELGASLDESYELDNCFNIFTHNIRFKLDPKKREDKSKNQDSEEASASGYETNIMKNLRFTINGLHIRYEDDFFSASPFACGILCDQVTSHGSNTQWNFGSLESNKFTRITPK